ACGHGARASQSAASDSCGLLPIHSLHGLRIRTIASEIVKAGISFIKGSTRSNVAALPLGLGLQRFRLSDRGHALLQSIGCWRFPEWMVVTHGHAPPCHGTSGIGVSDGREGASRLLVPERVQHRYGAGKNLLRGWRAGHWEANASHLPNSRAVIVPLIGRQPYRNHYEKKQNA